MNQEQFTAAVRRTESPTYYAELVDPRILHGTIGMVTEAGELLDAVKKSLFYGKPLDIVNVQEEIGDLAYYLFLLMDALDADWNTILEANVSKLQKRYPEKFTQDNATINRDVQGERALLEQQLS